MKSARLGVMGLAVGVLGGWALVIGGCANEQEKRGHELYTHYCSDCHGQSGKQNEGFNWSHVPDPKPKDLSNKPEMGTFKDEEIFATISRDMLDTSEEGGDPIGDDDFAVPTMPTFKYTLSEDEISHLAIPVPPNQSRHRGRPEIFRFAQTVSGRTRQLRFILMNGAPAGGCSSIMLS